MRMKLIRRAHHYLNETSTIPYTLLNNPYPTRLYCMLNTKLYKTVYQLAEKLIKAANKNDELTFNTHYAELKEVCITHENTEKDHPVQWETLADFTDETESAIALYEKALVKATDANAKDYIASIHYSMAQLKLELDQTTSAIEHLQAAKISANKIEDKELKEQIEILLNEQLGE